MFNKKTPTALAKQLTAVGTEIDKLEGSVREAEAQAVALAAEGGDAYREAEANVEQLQQQTAERHRRRERLKAAHRQAVARELDEEIARLRSDREKQLKELERINSEADAARANEERRHKEAMDSLSRNQAESRQRVDATKRSLAEAMERKRQANPDVIAHLIQLRDAGRTKADGIKKELDGAELALSQAREEYNRAVNVGHEAHTIRGYEDKKKARLANVEAIKARMQKVDSDRARLTASLRELGGDPNHHGV